METFIVRIYRKGNGSPDAISGLVEEVEKDETQGFTTKEELWTIINPRSTREGKAPEKNGREKK